MSDILFGLYLLCIGTIAVTTYGFWLHWITKPIREDQERRWKAIRERRKALEKKASGV